jgi:hypothetical protein
MMWERGRQDSTKPARVAIAWAFAVLVVGCGESADSKLGSGGASGSGGTAGNGAAGPCVDVSQVDELQIYDLQVIGTGFAAHEGHVIRILATHGEPTYGLGQAPIVDGAFDIFLPSVLGDYTGIAVHLDTTRDDACDPETEFIWQWTTGPASARGPAFRQGHSPGDAVWDVTPDSLRVFEEAGPCNLNGIFDLTTPLSCPAD